MGDDEQRARFARIREQIRAAAKTAGQASLATGILILTVPGGEVSAGTTPDQIQVASYDEAAADARVTQPVASTDDVTLNEDFDDAFKDFSDNTSPA